MSTPVSEEEVSEKTRVKSNLYKVPINIIKLFSCSEGRPLQGYHHVKWIIEAKSPQAAILDLIESPSYLKNWNSHSPEKRKQLIEKRYEPFDINLEKKIEEIPNCENRHKTIREDYVCGVPSTDGEPDLNGINGDFGDCICENCWTPNTDDLRTGCPYKQILGNY